MEVGRGVGGAVGEVFGLMTFSVGGGVVGDHVGAVGDCDDGCTIRAIWVGL